jgi:predicted transcriptional regulator
MATATATRLDPEIVSEVERWLPAALAGDERAVRWYARAWYQLVQAICSDHPGAPASAADVLDHLALTAPFDPAGPIGALVSAASAIIPDMDVPTIPRTARRALPGTVDYQRFARVVLAELSGAGTGLERLLAAWGLTVTDVARLFGVRRQAVQQWLDEGVPGARQPKLHTILEIADLLERNLLPERIPGIVRATSEAYGGRSMLELLANDRHDELLESVRRSFDWAWSA